MTATRRAPARTTRQPFALASCAVLALCAFFGGGCEATRVAGPTVAFRNDSTTPMTVHYWVGGRDTGDTDSGGSKLRQAATLEVEPGRRAETSLTPLWHYRSAEHTVVRAQVIPAESPGADPDAPAEYWFELGAPSPYSLRAIAVREGNVKGLRFVRDGRGTFVTVPEQFWVKSK